MAEHIVQEANPLLLKDVEGSINEELNEFNVVLSVSWRGDLIEAHVNEAMKGFEPDTLGKASVMAAWISNNIASMLSDEVKEIDIVMGNKLLVIFPEAGKVRVGITSAV